MHCEVLTIISDVLIIGWRGPFVFFLISLNYLPVIYSRT